MNRIGKLLAIGGLLGAVALLAFAQFNPDPTAPPPDYAAQISALEMKLAAYEQAPIAERVIELPDDGGLWQTVLVYSTPDRSTAADRRLAANWATTPRLQSLLAQTRKYEIEPGHAWDYWIRNHLAGKPLPAVVVQKPSGEVVYRAGADALPVDGETQANQIAQMIADCRPLRPTPTPTPTPVGPPPDITPNIQPDGALPEGGDEMEWWVYGLIALSGLGGGYAALKK